MKRREFLRLGQVTGAAAAVTYLSRHSAIAKPLLNQAAASAETVTVTVDPKKTIGQSKLEIGVTHTRYSLDTGGDPQAIVRGKDLLRAACRLHNVHIMGWGTSNPSPAPGVYDWASLDKRMAMVRSIPGAVPVITLCAAPDWMKGGEPGKTDWKRIEAAPRPEHYADFAALAATVARRYPDVRYFQVWNEMKGLWDAPSNNWNYRGYTDLYNRCYDALQAVSRENKVGGPYLVMEGTGGNKGPASDATKPPVSPRNMTVIDYWLQHKKGADFLTIDRGINSFHDKNVYTLDEQMRLTHWFGDIARQVRARPGAENLPLWWAEFYASGRTTVPEAKAAINASAYRHALLGGASTILIWQPMDTNEVGHALFTDARRADGGRPLPLYAVVKGFHEHFGPETPLFAAESSLETVEVLVSPKATLLINKSPNPVSVRVREKDRRSDLKSLILAGYEVRFL